MECYINFFTVYIVLGKIAIEKMDGLLLNLITKTNGRINSSFLKMEC